MVNVWALPAEIFFMPALHLARDGFIVLLYSSRGFGGSTGASDVGGPSDQQDAIAVVDWLLENAPVDRHHLGMTGVSSGASIALLTAAADARIKTVVSLGGWLDFCDSFLADHTFRHAWMNFVTFWGKPFGEIDPATLALLQRFKQNEISKGMLQNFCAVRSPALRLEAYNARAFPLKLIYNIDDTLVRPNQVIKFFSQIRGPKQLELVPGGHVSSEIVSLFNKGKGIPWSLVQSWVKDWLREEGAAPHFLSSAVGIALGDRGEGARRLEFPSWPIPHISEQHYYLSSQQDDSFHFLQQVKPSTIASYRIYTNQWTGINRGVPVMGPSLQHHLNIPILSWLPLINRRGAAVFLGEETTTPRRYVGVGKLELTVVPSLPQAQVVAYLFAVDNRQVGRLLAQGTTTLIEAQAARPLSVAFELGFAAFELPRGQRLALVLTTSDPHYRPPTPQPDHLDLLLGPAQGSRLSLPLLP
jgi:predicted acyl esterase